MHYGTCVTQVPWCMSGSLTRGGGGYIPSIPGACTTRNFTYLARSPWAQWWLNASDWNWKSFMQFDCFHILYIFCICFCCKWLSDAYENGIHTPGGVNACGEWLMLSSSPDWHIDQCCVHNASTVPWTSAGQFGRPRGVRGRPWYDLWRPRCVISHPMDVRGLPPGRPPSGRPRDTQFGIDWSLLPSGCPQGVRTAEVQPITARTHYGQEVGLPTVRPKPEVDVP